MKGFLAFFYFALTVFACIGGGGYCLYIGEPQFGIALLVLEGIISAAFFKAIPLPDKDWID